MGLIVSIRTRRPPAARAEKALRARGVAQMGLLFLAACGGHPDPQAKDSSQPNDTAPDTAETGLDSSDSADTGSPPDTGDSADTTETGDTADTGGWDDVTWLSSADGRITGCAGEGQGVEISVQAGWLASQHGYGSVDIFALPVHGPVSCGAAQTMGGAGAHVVYTTVWGALAAGDTTSDLVVGSAGWVGVFDGGSLGTAILDAPDLLISNADNPAAARPPSATADDLIVRGTTGIHLLRGPLLTSGDAAELADVTVLSDPGYGGGVGMTSALAALNADGLLDIVSAAYGHDTVGRVVIVNGGVTGTVSETDADAVLWADSREALGSGTSIAHGDSDGDGTEDLLLSAPDAPLDDHTHSGAVYVLAGPVTGEHTLPEGGPSIVRGDGGILGGALDAADADGDGRTDILVGEPAAFGPDGYPVGGADLVLGPFIGTVDLAIDAPFRHFLSDSPRAYAGYTVALTDLDGDDLADVVIGAPDDDVATIDGGAIYLFYSSGWD